MFKGGRNRGGGFNNIDAGYVLNKTSSPIKCFPYIHVENQQFFFVQSIKIQGVRVISFFFLRLSEVKIYRAENREKERI